MRNLLKQGLRRLVERDEDRRPRGSHRAVVIAVAAEKGGVGKTTTSVNLGAALARQFGRRVLVVDLDPQGHVSRALHARVKPGGGAISGVLEQEGGEVLDVVAATEVPGLDITPADPRLREVESLLTTRIGKEFVLRDALAVTRTWYDIILLDCPPNLGNLTVNALVAADRVLVPSEATPLAMDGVSGLLRTCGALTERLNPELDLLGVVVTRYDARNVTLNERVLSEMQEAWGDALFDVRIGISTGLARAQSEGVDVFAHDPRGRGAKDHAALAVQVLERLGVR